MSGTVAPALFQIAHGLFAHPLRNLAPTRGRQFYAGATRLGQADGNGLPGRAGTMHTFADVMKFFPDKFTGLGGR
jgi:hypothetical protein